MFGKKIRKIYNDAFPEAERRPWESIVMLSVDEPRYHFETLKSGRATVGLVTTWDLGSFVYVEHLAVDSALRGQGIGGRALRDVVAKAAGRPVVLEVEPKEFSAQAERRIGFYQRAGFKLYDDFKYLQPPYAEGLPSVELRLMSTAQLSARQLESITDTLHSQVYDPGINKKVRRFRMKNVIASVTISVIAMLIANIFFARCSTKPVVEQSKVAVVSLEPLRGIVADVAGPEWEIVSLMPPGTNPEAFDPTMAMLKKIESGNVMFYTGANGAEASVVERLGNNGKGGSLVDLTDNLQLMRGTHGDHDHGVDPHIWTSLRNLRQVAMDAAEALASLDSENAEAYRHRADSISNVYLEADSAIAKSLALASGHAFAVNHPSLSYFARDYGLKQVALGGEHKELSTRRLAAMLEHIEADSVKVMFVESQVDSQRAMNVASQLGLRIVVLPTNTSDPLALIRAAAASLR